MILSTSFNYVSCQQKHTDCIIFCVYSRVFKKTFKSHPYVLQIFLLWFYANIKGSVHLFHKELELKAWIQIMLKNPLLVYVYFNFILAIMGKRFDTIYM